jgi:hypothetical protein
MPFLEPVAEEIPFRDFFLQCRLVPIRGHVPLAFRHKQASSNQPSTSAQETATLHIPLKPLICGMSMKYLALTLWRTSRHLHATGPRNSMIRLEPTDSPEPGLVFGDLPGAFSGCPSISPTSWGTFLRKPSPCLCQIRVRTRFKAGRPTRTPVHGDEGFHRQTVRIPAKSSSLILPASFRASSFPCR